MANAQAIATVISISGRALARDVDGNTRVLKPGDVLLEGETLITSDGGRVELALVDSSMLQIADNQSVLMTAELSEATRPAAPEAQLADGTIQQVIQALNDGSNLDDVLEEPAAGLTGGGSGEGSGFVRLLRIAEGVDPLEFEFDATVADVPPELLPGRGVDEDDALVSSDTPPDAPGNVAPETAMTVAVGAEDAAGITVNLSGTDPDGTVTHFVIKTLPVNGVLQLNGTALAVGDSIPA
ncbi:MAG: hypothetical protein CVU28_10850, partial [Betaproteobacteria bacterium HGW-Betaproteobacteria-21]